MSELSRQKLKKILLKRDKSNFIDFEVLADNYSWVLSIPVGVPTNIVSVISLIV